MNLDGTVALVTGGAHRVGRGIALELARAGCDIALHYHQSAEAADLLVSQIRASGNRAVAVQGDLSSEDTWPRIVSQSVDALGRLDILINNASSFLTPQPDTLENFSVSAWDAMQRVNLTAPVGLAHHARAQLEANGAGRIINLCDIASDRPHPAHLAYVCSKAGLVAMTKALARALAPRVTVNGVAPGIAVFPESYNEQQRNSLLDAVPLLRSGSPEDIARTVRFLAESGDYITGQIFRVDGGRSIV